MIRGIKELLEILFLWGFIYVGSFIVLIIGLVHVQSNQPIINEQHYYTTKQVFQGPKRVLVEREVCNRIDGCPIVNNICVDCITVKN
jgi:hypothetical protein